MHRNKETQTLLAFNNYLMNFYRFEFSFNDFCEAFWRSLKNWESQELCWAHDRLVPLSWTWENINEKQALIYQTSSREKRTVYNFQLFTALKGFHESSCLGFVGIHRIFVSILYFIE